MEVIENREKHVVQVLGALAMSRKEQKREDGEEQGSRPEGCELSYGKIPLNAELSDLKGTLSLDLILPGSWHFRNKQII